MCVYMHVYILLKMLVKGKEEQKDYVVVERIRKFKFLNLI